eukprot:gene20222-7266_t
MAGINKPMHHDVWLFSLEAGKWHHLKPIGDAPSGRSGHATITHQRNLILFGGMTEKEDDACKLFVLDLSLDPVVWRSHDLAVARLPAA